MLIAAAAVSADYFHDELINYLVCKMSDQSLQSTSFVRPAVKKHKYS